MQKDEGLCQILFPYIKKKKTKKTKLRGRSLQVNYTDRVTANCQQS
jgi:hypothetical protein